MMRIASLEAELSKLRTQIASYALRQEDVEPHQQGEHLATRCRTGKYPLVGDITYLLASTSLSQTVHVTGEFIVSVPQHIQDPPISVYAVSAS